MAPRLEASHLKSSRKYWEPQTVWNRRAVGTGHRQFSRLDDHLEPDDATTNAKFRRVLSPRLCGFPSPPLNPQYISSFHFPIEASPRTSNSKFVSKRLERFLTRGYPVRFVSSLPELAHWSNFWEILDGLLWILLAIGHPVETFDWVALVVPFVVYDRDPRCSASKRQRFEFYPSPRVLAPVVLLAVKVATTKITRRVCCVPVGMRRMSHVCLVQFDTSFVSANSPNHPGLPRVLAHCRLSLRAEPNKTEPFPVETSIRMAYSAGINIGRFTRGLHRQQTLNNKKILEIIICDSLKWWYL